MNSPAAILARPARRPGAKPSPEPARAADDLSKIKLAYTIPETCDTLGVKKSFVYNMVRDGRLKMVKLGTRSLIPADSLRAFVASLPEAQPEARAA